MQGEPFGPYRIERELGSGGMGSVFAASDANGTRVALKLVHPHLMARPGFKERFLREAEVGRRIDHPNVIRTLDAGEIDGQPYIALEFVEGQTLGELRVELGRVSETLCRHIGTLAARGLAAIHAQGVVHRDVKPENVLITADHEVRLMDLGLARSEAGLDRMTRTGQFVGSPAYAPPEQFRGEGALDARSDLYSLGVTLFELATGSPPFRAQSMEALAAKIATEPPPRTAQFGAEISPFFEAILFNLMAKDPRRRVESAQKLADLLEAGEASEWWSAEATRVEDHAVRPPARIRVPRETECVGREVELATLRGAFEAARAGEGCVVLVEGEAGIGKSRLVDEFVHRLGADGEAVEFLYGVCAPGGAATATGAFVQAYRDSLGLEGSARHLTDAPALVPAFDALLRGDAPPVGTQALTLDSLMTAFVHATRALGRLRPTVVVIDDLHFAPDEGRSLFASLAMAVPGHRILLVGTTRPSLPVEWRAEMGRLDHVARVPMVRMQPADMRRLLLPMLGVSLHAERLASAISAKADGNPYFLFELVRSLREKGVLSRAASGKWATLAQVHELLLPGSVQSLLDVRIGRLTDEERELLECAACWGTEFDGRLVAEALGMRSLPGLRLLGRIEHEHGLVRAAGGRFAFDHHAIREHLHSGLPQAVREELHAALAQVLETRTNAAQIEPEALGGDLCVDLCTHFLAGTRGPAARRYLPVAQAHLSGRHRLTELCALTECALAAPGLIAGADRVRTLLRFAATLDRMGRRQRESEVVLEAERLAEELRDDGLRQQTAAAVGTYLWWTSRNDEAETAFRRALELARSLSDRVALASATGNLGNVLKARNRHAEARELYEAQLAIGCEIGDRSVEARAHGSLGNVDFALSRHDDARQHYERSLTLCLVLQDLPGEASALGNLGNVAFTLGRLDEARERFERQLDLTREVGDRTGEARATGAVAMVVKASGRLAEAPQRYERALELSREIGYRSGEAVVLVNLGSCRLALGELQNAREAFTASLGVCREIAARYPEGYALAGLSAVADEEGNSADAMARIEDSLAVRRAIGHADGVGDSLVELGDLRRRAGDTIGARATIEEALALSRERGRVAGVVQSLALLACLPGGSTDAAEVALRDSAGAGDSLRVRHCLWEATGDGAHLAEAKRRLDEILSKVPADRRRALLTNLRLHREIAAACREAGPPARDPAHFDGGGPESETRIG